jgi:hypothetical protein
MPEERIPEAWIGSEVVAVIYAARQHVDSALLARMPLDAHLEASKCRSMQDPANRLRRISFYGVR